MKEKRFNPGEVLLAVHLSELGVAYETHYRYAKGRKLEADLALTVYDLLIEVVGGVYDRRAHGSVTGVLADIDRLNTATINGWAMLRFTPQQVDDGSAKKLIAKHLGLDTRVKGVPDGG